MSALAAVAGCASSASKDTASGPKYTAEEKAAMTEEEKLAIYNENVRDKDRVTCTAQRSTGSHMTRRVCKSAEQRRVEREAAEDSLRNSRRLPAGETGGN
ncbi:MAG TPA: hypothetical protein VM616_11210 [Gammaproteobacteria bacterium]|nr:hypothetical protein [Gammaproteobacteria bacterium]